MRAKPQTKPLGTPAQDPPAQKLRESAVVAWHGARMVVANLISQVVFGLLAMAIALPSMQEWGALRCQPGQDFIPVPT